MAFQIVRNSITQMHTDAIVNTANSKVGYGSGIDEEIYKAAGVQSLLSEREKVGEVEPGNSFATDSFGLLQNGVKKIIHTVGTVWTDGDNNEEKILRQCYRTSLKLAKELGVESISFPLLASGNNGYPKSLALDVAVSEFSLFLRDNDMEIFLVVYDRESFELTGKIFGDIDSYISDNLVELPKRRPSQAGYEPFFGARPIAGPEPVMSAPIMMQEESKPIKRRSSSKKKSVFSRKGFSAEDSEDFEECDIIAATVFSEHEYVKRSLDDVISNLDKTFMEMVFSFADAKEISDVDVRKRANLDKKAFSKLKCGTTKNPSKNTALAFAIALELSLDDTKDLLSRAGYALSPCSKTDLIVKYFIERNVYDIFAINIALFEHGEQLLGSQNA